MVATIWSGAANASDWFFLIATILAGLAAILHLLPAPTTTSPAAKLPWTSFLVAAAIALVALGLLAI
jgi:hypothetical protein